MQSYLSEILVNEASPEHQAKLRNFLNFIHQLFFVDFDVMLIQAAEQLVTHTNNFWWQMNRLANSTLIWVIFHLFWVCSPAVIVWYDVLWIELTTSHILIIWLKLHTTHTINLLSFTVRNSHLYLPKTHQNLLYGVMRLDEL